MFYLKDLFLLKVDFEKNQQTTKKHNNPVQNLPFIPTHCVGSLWMLQASHDRRHGSPSEHAPVDGMGVVVPAATE